MPNIKKIPSPILLHLDSGKNIVKCSDCDVEIETEEPVESMVDLVPKSAKPFEKHLRERHAHEDFSQVPN